MEKLENRVLWNPNASWNSIGPMIKFYLLSLQTLLFSLVFSQKMGTISGIVSDSIQTLPNIEVQLLPENLIQKSNSYGVFLFSNLRSGEHQLSIQAKGFQAIMIHIFVSEDSPIFLDTIRLVRTKLEGEIIVRQNAQKDTPEIRKTKNTISVVAIKAKKTLDKLPNKNAADLASRMPSVMLFRSKGESNMVSLRGTPIDWTSVLVDGDRLPVACEDNTTRSLEFEAFPSDFVNEVVEVRSITPDFEADNIGGSLNFLTLTPQYKKLMHLDVSIGANFKGIKPSGDMNFMYNNTTKNKKWAYLINGTYYGRGYESEAIKTIFGSNFNHGLNRLELRRYEGFRSTEGGQFTIIYKLSDQFSFKLNSFIGRMVDDKNMDKISFNWFEDNGQRVRLQNCKAKLIRQIQGAAFNMEFIPNKKISSTFRMAMYRNEFKNGPVPHAKNDPRNGFFICEFMSPELHFNDLVLVDLYGQPYSPSSPDYALLKLIGADNPFGTGDDPNRVYPHFDADLKNTDFQFTQCYTEINRTMEFDPIVLRNDWEFSINNQLTFQFGAKYRYKEGMRSLSKHDWFQDFTNGNSNPIYMQELATFPFNSGNQSFMSHPLGETYSAFNYGFLTDEQLTQFLTDYDSRLREVAMNPLNFEFNQWVGSNYSYSEHQSSFYTMLTYASDKIAVLSGIRLEHTYLTESSDTLTNMIAFDSLSGTYYNVPETRTIRRGYFGILPSVNLNYYLSQHSTLKLAVSRTMHRPNFEETKPGHAVIRYNEMEYTFGNPLLNPAYSLNFDAFYEHYSGNQGIFTLGFYYKNIQDHIYTLSALNTDPISGVTMRKYGNAKRAWVAGVEMLFDQKFDFLQKFWSHFGIRSNATLSLSRMQIDGRPKSQEMTKQTPILYSINLYYEDKNFDVNAALLYTGRYVSELNLTYLNGELLHKNNQFDTYINPNYSLEFSSSYALSAHWRLEVQFTNLLNFAERKSRGDAWRASYVEYYGIRGQIALHWDL
jgi:outer membrane cobalamin receptor